MPSRDCTPRALPRAQGATSAVGLLAMARQEAFRILPYSFFSLQDSFISVPRPYSELPGKAQKKLRSFDRSFMLALPIFPCSHPQSIVGANELNFCVRDGNRWTLIAINTNYMDKSFRFHRLIRSVARPVCQSALRSNSLCILARYFRSVKHFSPP